MNFGELLDTAGLELLPVFATSLAIGLLIGLERERNPYAKASLRTIALTTLFGTLIALLAEVTATPWLPAAGLLAVGAMIIAAYLDEQNGAAQSDPGTTTVIAVLLAYGLGMLTYLGHGNLAIALAVIITALLYFKPELRGLLQRFGRRDLLAVLQFVALTFVVLPVLPDRGYGPYGALNPHHNMADGRADFRIELGRLYPAQARRPQAQHGIARRFRGAHLDHGHNYAVLEARTR